MRVATITEQYHEQIKCRVGKCFTKRKTRKVQQSVIAYLGCKVIPNKAMLVLKLIVNLGDNCQTSTSSGKTTDTHQKGNIIAELEFDVRRERCAFGDVHEVFETES